MQNSAPPRTPEPVPLVCYLVDVPILLCRMALHRLDVNALKLPVQLLGN